MNINLQRAVDRWVGVPLCGLLSLFSGLFVRKPTPAKPRRILVIMLSEMGSLVLARPMFDRLRHRYPDASLHVMMFAKNREVLDLMEIVPPDQVLALRSDSVWGLVSDSLGALWRLRRLGVDAVIDGELFSRISSILALLSGAPLRVGFQPHTQEGLYRGSFINRPVLYNPYHHLSQQLLSMVEALEDDTCPLGKRLAPPMPTHVSPVTLSAKETAAMQSRLIADFPALRNRKLVLIYAGGGILPIRAWPTLNYAEVCARLLAEGFAVGLIGMTEDGPVAQEIKQHCKHDACIDLTGYTRSVRELLVLFHAASLLITNDGGPGQFAALTPISAIVLFGPETPLLYSPLSPRVHCLMAGLACSPCLTAYNHRRSPCDGNNQCLKQITPDEVLTLAQRLLHSAAEVAA